MLKFKPASHKTPGKEIVYSPQSVLDGYVGVDQLAEEISDSCTVNEADVVAVLRALQKHMYSHLRQGRSVRLGDVGSFRPSVYGKSAPTAEGVTADNIQGVHIRFRPSAWLTGKKGEYRFMRISSEKKEAQV